ncbi:MBL fold metallo-hydrolase [Candidatus Uhrbacteria bacterium]|nr:MBL fold metallo-hydrolase [Candidatus Uhrbacteria bacterium]
MNITWYGEACFKIETKYQNEEVTIVTYPFDADSSGLKLPRVLTADIVLQDGEKLAHPCETKDGKLPRTIGSPGEYEIRGVFVRAIPLKKEGGTGHLFWIETEDVVLVHTGLLSEVPDEAALQQIEDIDALFVPVGGSGVLDGEKAEKLVSELEPRVVIPMLFATPGLKMKRASIESAIKELGSKAETVPKLKLTRKDLPADETKLIVLGRS